MLTRRGFTGFASCALCGITEFVATAASAQGAPPAATGGVTRKILSQADGPVPGYVTMLVEATIEAGVPVGRHTHPGIESAFVLEGGFELPIQGQATRMLKPGDGFQIPRDTPHAGGKPGDATRRVLIASGAEKGKPLASPAASMIPKRGHRLSERSCSSSKPKQDDDSKKGRPALERLHSIPSSASGSSVRGTGSSSRRAVKALMTSSYLVDGMIRRSAGFAPLRMRPT